MSRDLATLQTYRSIELNQKEIKYLKQAARSFKDPFSKKTILDKISYNFPLKKLIRYFLPIDILEFKGVCPAEVRLLYHFGLINLMNKDNETINLCKDDDIIKSFAITDIGKMYLLYHKRWYCAHYIPIIISVFALIASAFSILF